LEIPMLSGIVIIFSLAVFVILVCQKFKIPTVVGYLITGIIAGPYGFELIKEIHLVDMLAEIGIILLLFTIGIEFSLDKFLSLKKPVLQGGALQLLFTGGLSFILVKILGLSINLAVFTGFLITLSSTAIVLKIIQERAEVDSPYGRASLGILIFQDIIVVPMMLLVPILAGEQGNLATSLLQVFLKGIAILVLVWISSKWIIPRLLHLIVKTKSRELFLLSIVVICFAIAWLTSRAGLSLALGAFLAGLVISESEYSYQALGSILPFKDIFTSFFFVSIGMLFNFGFAVENIVLILVATVVIIILKTVAASVSATILGFPVRSAVLVGLALSQVGEFSFILAKSAQQYDFFAGDLYNLFLAVSVITMALTPFLINSGPLLADRIMRLPLPSRLKTGCIPCGASETETLQDHLIIIGFGINGRNVSRAAGIAEVNYIIIEMNPDLVQSESSKGESIIQGDASQEAVLKHVNIQKAKVIVVAISDRAASRKITELARRLNSQVYIIVRTRYIRELDFLYELGADEVIPEEFETSIEIFARVLNKYLIPKDEIEELIDEIRSENYEMLRSINKRQNQHMLSLKMHVPEIELHTIRIRDDSPAVGKTLADIELRRKYGVSALAIRRNSDTIVNPHGDTGMRSNDIIVLVGIREKLLEVESILQADRVKKE